MSVKHNPWMKLPLEKKIITGFGFSLVLLVIIGIASYQTTLELADDEQNEIHANTELAKIEIISSKLKEVETDLLSYIITGEARYLAPHDAAVLAIDQEIRDLRELTADNPNQQRRIEILEPLIATRLADIKAAIDVRKSQGFESASNMVQASSGKLVMEDIQRVVDELNNEEQQLLEQHSIRLEDKARRTILIISFSSFLAVALVALATFIIVRDIRKREQVQKELRQSHRLLQAVVEGTTDAIFVKDLRGRYLMCNSTVAQTFGRSIADVIGKDDWALFPPDEARQLMEFDREILASGQSRTYEDLILVDGVPRTYLTTKSVYLDYHGNVIGIIGIGHDISERVEAYQLLERRVEERTQEIGRRRQVAEGLRDIMAILNSNRPLNEILDSIVAQACRLLGGDGGAVYHLQSQNEQLHIQASYGLDTDDTAHHIPISWGIVGDAMLQRQPVAVADTMVTMRDRNNSALEPRWREHLMRMSSRYGALLVVPLAVKDDRYGAIILYYRQPRQFSREEIELATAFGDQAALAIENARLRAQVEQAAIAAERSRLARDLHDAVTQTLFSASLIADVLPRLWERNVDEARRRLDELRQLTRGALAEMRMLLLELRPATLSEVGLHELLRQLTEAITGRARVLVSLTVQGQSDLPPDVQIAFYRIAQEALNNVARHSGASQAAVRLCSRPEQVELCISDDGQGFDPTSIPVKHLGLRIMRERAEAIGATLRIESQLGSGSQIAITWPQGNNVDGVSYEREPILNTSFLALARREADQRATPYSRADR